MWLLALLLLVSGTASADSVRAGAAQLIRNEPAGSAWKMAARAKVR
jgi:hypothetical protein